MQKGDKEAPQKNLIKFESSESPIDIENDPTPMDTGKRSKDVYPRTYGRTL